MDQSRKVFRHHWKELLKISKTAKFVSDTSKDSASQCSENLQAFVWWGEGGGASLYPPHKSVKCRDFEQLYLR